MAKDKTVPASSDVSHSEVTETTQEAKLRRTKSEPSVPTTSTTNKDRSKSTTLQGTAVKLNLIQTNLEYIKQASERLKDYSESLKYYEEGIADKVNRASEDLESLKKPSFAGRDKASAAAADQDPEEIEEFEQKVNLLHKNVIKLKAKIPSQIKSQSKDSKAYQKLQSRDDSEVRVKLKHRQVPKLYENPMFVKSETFKDIVEQYNGLDIRSKNCLLCFAVFPEDVTIKKRLMIYWWIGEGFIPAGKVAEEEGTQIFEHLIAKGFIEPVCVKLGLEVNSCKMNPLVRSGIVMLAERARFFDFDGDGNLTDKYTRSLRACLVGQGLTDIENLDKIHMLFNFNETILQFKADWFQQMKNANILNLGRWRSTGTQHIEADDPTFLEGLKHLKYLKFLSLQGVSSITELPDSISKLQALIILDIRACHNLEVIPKGIGLLENLTHLDMSECYLLERVPKNLSSLTNLIVLKGFVVDESNAKNSCRVEDLVKLEKLKKLTIYSSNFEDFPKWEDLNAFMKFQNLLKLTIEWGALRKPDTPSRKETASLSNTDKEAVTSKQDGEAQQREDAKGNSETSPQPTKTVPGESNGVAEEPKDRGESVAKETKKEENNEKSEIIQEPGKSDASGEEAKDKRESMVANKKKEENERGGEKQDQDKRVAFAADTKQNDEVKNSGAAKLDSRGPGKNENRGGAAAMKRATTSLLARSKTSPIKGKGGTSDSASVPAGLPPSLQKLDLKCFPASYTPDWLKPGRLQNLERVYIRGGKLRDLGQDFGWDVKHQEQWKNVKILRLKYLADMKMDWRELRQLFPKLTYLEKVKCPKLTLFPCDGYGVWINKAEPEKQ